MIKSAQNAYDRHAPGAVCEEYQLRAVTLDDIDAIFHIEMSSFSVPWPRSAFTEEIAQRNWSRVVGAYLNGELVGFMVYWLVAQELHLLNLAVHPKWRRQGIGQKLVEYLLADAARESRHSVLLEVRITNAAAIGLYRHYGFEELAIRPGYYADNGEDALVMLKEFDSAPLKK